MTIDLEQHRVAVEALCRRFGVMRLELFGSATSGDFDFERSDLDFLVEFHPCAPAKHFENYFGLLQALERLVGRSVDLVEPQTIRSAIVRRRVDESRMPLCVASHQGS